jgi:hypothetical protein
VRERSKLRDRCGVDLQRRRVARVHVLCAMRAPGTPEVAFICSNLVWWATRARKLRVRDSSDSISVADAGSCLGVAFREALLLVDDYGADPKDVKVLLAIAVLP